jgi:CHAT domain-containing protein
VLKAQEKWDQAIAAYNGAVLTLKSLRNDLAAINQDVQFSFRKSIEPVYREYVEVLLQPANTAQRKANLKTARDLIEALQLQEIDNFFREACLDAQRIILDQIVDQIAAQDQRQTAAVIYPIVLKNQLHVIVKLPKQEELRSRTFPEDKTSVEQTLAALRRELQQPDPNQETKRLSKQVYDWLIQPFEEDLKNSGVKTLVFVLDGAFRNIPVAALNDGEQYLIEKGYSVALSLGLQLQKPEAISKEPLRVLAAGLKKPEGQFAQMFSELPGVESELQSIREIGIDVTVLPDREFTEEKFGQQVKEVPYNVVHLATHGQFSSEAENTFILASNKLILVKEFDSLIRDRQRVQSQPIELLLLSACETAKGDDRAALGLAGVAVKAGARSTIASLWKVTDDSTALLIKEFYRNLKTRNMSKAEALRLAQIELLKDQEYKAPRFWSPFILIGNWL